MAGQLEHAVPNIINGCNIEIPDERFGHFISNARAQESKGRQHAWGRGYDDWVTLAEYGQSIAMQWPRSAISYQAEIFEIGSLPGRG
jgi:hypothetical protein